jgi:hypothetical protein
VSENKNTIVFCKSEAIYKNRTEKLLANEHAIAKKEDIFSIDVLYEWNGIYTNTVNCKGTNKKALSLVKIGE